MKYYVITFVLGVALGLFVSFMYCTMLNETPSSKPLAKVTTELKKEVAKSEVSYSKVVDSLKVKSVKLQSQLTNAKSELAKSKQSNYSLQLKIYGLIDKQPNDNHDQDRVANNNCDSLIETVGELMLQSSQKDSLYEAVTTNLEDQLKNKDSTILVKDKQYSEIKSAFAKSIENSEKASAQNKLLNKRAKSLKFKSKVLTAALFILTGAAANYLIHH